MGAPDRIRESLLTASHWICGGRQVDPVTMRANHPSSLLKPPIEFLRPARLTNIESLCVHLNRDCDRIILSRSTTGEKCACGYGGAKDPPGTHGSCLGVHMKLLMKALTMIWFIDNESSRRDLDT